MSAEQDRLDAARMRSMADALRQDMAFSFNPFDMAEMLDRTADRIEPKLRLCAGVPHKSEGQSDG